MYMCVQACLSIAMLAFFCSMHSGLSGNPLTTLETGVFRGLESLRILQLENCQIETLDEEAFFNLTQLRIL